jgi:hypothetical protein
MVRKLIFMFIRVVIIKWPAPNAVVLVITYRL